MATTDTQQRAPKKARRWLLAAVTAALAALALLLAVALTGTPPQSAATEPRRHTQPPVTTAAPAQRPNIVFVLTDDLSWDLVPYMPHLHALQQDGMTFTNYTVTDSLCCPSRASIFTGNFPHDTRVFTNTEPDGGFAKFTARHEDNSTFATAVSSAGYQTGFIGKYLNGYAPTPAIGHFFGLAARAYVPPGWSSWNGVGFGYFEYNYAIADGRRVQFNGHAPRDYLTTVAQDRGVRFIQSAAHDHRPFLLEIATFTPHKPYTPAPADVGTFAGLRAPRTPAFGRMPTHPPRWLAAHPPLGAVTRAYLDRAFDLRVEDVQSIDRMIGVLQSTLLRTGLAKNTIFVFSSDNGYHLGQYRLREGKQTAFDTDVVVPLIVAGPGIPADSRNADIVENIDLRPTLDALAGARTPASVDGRSLVPLLHGAHPPWRTIAAIEHHHTPDSRADPDAQTRLQADPPSYDAIRTAQYTYVRYSDGEREYYDRSTDPYELDNLAPLLSRASIAQLDRTMNRLVSCHGARSCWAAGQPR